MTESGFTLGDQIIYGDELIVTSEDVPQSEEIVGGADSDPYVGLYESVPLPGLASVSSMGGNNKRGVRGKIKREIDLESLSEGRMKGGNWQQKQVSIKTLEGEFSVTMWASGADEGENVLNDLKVRNESFSFNSSSKYRVGVLACHVTCPGFP